MKVSLIFEVVSAVTLVGGFVFAIVQLRQHRADSDKEAALELVEDFFSGPVRISWSKLQRYVQGEREEQARDTIEEWFEWLNDQIARRESAQPPLPAHVAHRDWRPRLRG